MKTIPRTFTERTGLFYTDGTPIREGDIAIFWHRRESSGKLAPFEREVVWDDNSAAYVTYYNDGEGFGNYLAEEINDVNCAKVTKKA